MDEPKLWHVARLAEKLLNRMKLINGDDTNCIYADATPTNGIDPDLCANHVLIHEMDAAIAALPACAHENTWFDRTVALRSNGVEGMANICCACGKDMSNG